MTDVPSLGGQPSFYLMVQMFMFRDKLRNVEPMTSLMQGLSDDDLRKLADALSKLPPPKANIQQPPDLERTERASALVGEHRCAFCHNPDFSGAQQVPSLAGQREDYLLKAMRAYKSNERRGYDPTMSAVVYPLDDSQLKDLAYFLSRSQRTPLPPAKN